MNRLDECLKLRDKINGINEKITIIRESMYHPRIQKYSDMPRSYSETNAMDVYVTELERLTNKEKKLTEQLNNKIKKICSDIEDRETAELITLRFYYGLTWKSCSEHLNKRHTNENWNENKCFRIYKKMLTKKYKKV